MNTNFKVIGSIRLEIKPESTALKVDTRQPELVKSDYASVTALCTSVYSYYNCVFSGYTLNSQLYQKLCIRYASKDLKISMDDFVLLSVRLEAMFGECLIEFEIWLQISIVPHANEKSR